MRILVLMTVILPASSPATEYHVSTGDEFIEAIGPDRTIVIEEGIIVLDDSYPLVFEDPAEPGFAYTGWDRARDGWELTVSMVDDLTITGCGDLGTKLVSSYPEAFVLTFRDCDGLNLENISMGHLTGGTCDGGVLMLERCEDVTIQDCDLWGCGTVGLLTRECDGLDFVNSVIRDCTLEIMRLVDSTDLLFTGSEFIRSDAYDGISMVRSSGIVFEDCLVEDNRIGGTMLDAFLFGVWETGRVTIRNCVIRNNTCDAVFDDEGNFALENVEEECNTLTPR
jgi:hypothetical protein